MNSTNLVNDTELPTKEQLKKVAQICTMLEAPAVEHIVRSLQRYGDTKTKALITNAFRYHTILKYLRQLKSVHLVRREELGSEVYYKLNHERLRKISEAIEGI